ncbi:MAG TPA: sulfite exporter TauE/SafE family protein [Alphaproteobacteria bacterium]|nr:sulfite exporter TauE/SafE family protein [Alphaproteobacteria bacterium]USO05996.1 MAG: sulfite exporter TauE/SafE family protein [Rhodospirillales bacterium]HOO82618.1 sulfite exporter TauE/SafE family protein [Alphaproteobacteria bacterium]
MQIYLPIAEMAVSAETVFMLSAFVGLLSGIFGVGGGFLTTPFLIFFGIPPAVSVATQASQLVASSMAGAMGHFRRGNVDIKMGLVMVSGGAVGSVVGIFIFKLLRYLGQIDFAISFLYIILLGGIGILMIMESFVSVLKKKEGVRKAFNDSKVSPWVLSLPYKMRFPRSKLFVSALVPAGIGFVGGVLASVLGIGGGFLIVPAMIYILGMPPLLVAGTSLFQVIFTTAAATIMHALMNHTVDIVLGLILILGGVVGAQFGVVLARFFKGQTARVTLAIIILSVCLKLVVDLFVMPVDLFSAEYVR